MFYFVATAHPRYHADFMMSHWLDASLHEHGVDRGDEPVWPGPAIISAADLGKVVVPPPAGRFENPRSYFWYIEGTTTPVVLLQPRPLCKRQLNPFSGTTIAIRKFTLLTRTAELRAQNRRDETACLAPARMYRGRQRS